MSDRSHHEPPTLPRPKTWRLVVAAIVVVAFLYWMYRTGEREGDVAPRPPAGQSSLTVTAPAAG